jgi:hypothetical protein
LRGKKRREFKQKILDRIENLEADNPKEYWSLVNEHSDKPESSIDGETWYKYFFLN